MTMLVAAPHRLVPSYGGHVQLILADGRHLLDLIAQDLLMLRVARYAADAPTLMLRFAELGRCPPEQAQGSLDRGLKQGWLCPLRWRDGAPPVARAAPAEGAVTLQYSPLDGALLFSQHVQALFRAQPYSQPVAGTLSGLIRQWDELNAIESSVVLGEASWSRSLIENGHWLGLCLVPTQQGWLPPGLVCDPFTAGYLPGAQLILCSEQVITQYGWLSSSGPSSLLMLGTLIPQGRLLCVSAEGFTPAAINSPDDIADLLSLALQIMPSLPDKTAQSLRIRALKQHLQGIALSDDDTLRTALMRQWCISTDRGLDWADAYGLDGPEDSHPPSLTGHRLAALRARCQQLDRLATASAQEEGMHV